MSPFKPAWRRRSAVGALLFSLAPSSIPAGSTFTRSTTATYVDASGVVQTAAINALRSGHFVGGVQSILLEGQSTNLLTKSQQFDDAAWAKAGSTVTADQAVAPDGTTTADALIEDGTTGGHSVQTPAISAVATTNYCVSVFAKASTRTKIMVYGLNGDGKGVGFDLSNGTTFTVSGIVQSATFGVQALTGTMAGWYRCWIVTAAAATSTVAIGGVYLVSGTAFSYTGDSASKAFVWGAQSEVGTFPSSYIPTTTVAVTRGADSLSFPFTPNPQALTVYQKHIDVGSRSTNTARHFNIGAQVGERFFAFNAGAGGTYRVGKNNSSSTGIATVNLNDSTEIRAVLNADGSATQGVSINAAAEQLDSVVTTAPLAGAFSAARVYIGVDGDGAGGAGFLAVQSLKIASGVQSLAVMRSL